MSTNAPTWDDVATLARAASALLDSRDLSHDLTLELAGPIIRRMSAMLAVLETDPHGDGEAARGTWRTPHEAAAVVDGSDAEPVIGIDTDAITQEQIDDLVSRARALGVEVDVDAEVDAAWAAHGGSVATAVGVRGEFLAETATVLIAVLVRDNETERNR